MRFSAALYVQNFYSIERSSEKKSNRTVLSSRSVFKSKTNVLSKNFQTIYLRLNEEWPECWPRFILK